MQNFREVIGYGPASFRIKIEDVQYRLRSTAKMEFLLVRLQVKNVRELFDRKVTDDV